MTSRSPQAKEREKLLWIRLQMIARCQNHHFKNYGGRGIAVCDRWRESPCAFIADVSPRPMGLTLDRPNNSRGYGPDNFRWCTRTEQNQNRRNNIHVMHDGERLVLKEACRRLGLSYRAIHKRVRVQGMTPEAALMAPPRYRKAA